MDTLIAAGSVKGGTEKEEEKEMVEKDCHAKGRQEETQWRMTEIR